jgi:uncharacterized membrane protein YqaE (UPF0057 family)
MKSYNISITFEKYIYNKKWEINNENEDGQDGKDRQDEQDGLDIESLFIELQNYIKLYNINDETPDIGLDIKDFYFIKDNKLLSPNTKLKLSNCNIHNTISISCYRKQRGGDDILDAILDAIFSVFDVIVKPIVMIGNVIIFLIKIVFWLIKFIIWLVQFVLWVFTDLLNPKNFLADFVGSIMLIIQTIFGSIFNICMALFSNAVNTLGGWMQGFWGWDMSGLTKNDKNSLYFKSFDKTNGQKSYITNTNTVPFSIILGTVLCPPMGVFMDMGATGWFNVMICALLTLLFYLPGLCYALLIIYA